MIWLFFFVGWRKKQIWNNFVLLFCKIRMNDAFFFWLWNTKTVAIDQNPQNSITNNGHMNSNNQSTERQSTSLCYYYLCLSALHIHIHWLLLFAVCVYEMKWILFILQWTTRSCLKGLTSSMLLTNEQHHMNVLILSMVVLSWKPSSGWWRSE